MRSNITVINDEALLVATRKLLSDSESTEAQLLLHLGEVDDRKLWAARGYGSMHVFCTVTLNMSDSVAYDRIAVARLARRFPDILARIQNGELNLTALRVLGPHLDEDNYADLLCRARGKSIAKVKELVVELAPQPHVPDTIRKLPTRDVAPAPTFAPVPSFELSLFGTAPAAATHFDTSPVLAASSKLGTAEATSSELLGPISSHTPAEAAVRTSVVAVSAPSHSSLAPVPPTRAKGRVEPLAPDAYKVEFTADKELKTLLEQAAELLSHRKGQRQLASIVKQGVKLLVEKVKKERFGMGTKSRAKKEEESTPAPQKEVTRRAPKALVRETFEREGLQCTFVSDDGHRCEARSMLQLEHKEGFARTRRHEALTVLCAAHNAYQADRLYGRDFMDQKRAGFRIDTKVAEPDASSPPTSE